ncbi:uncharacterized protein LOC8265152 [Ricinus communis]|uniref:Cotton fiber protein n=1 Tax=Ricinus communis TaxID=3988 RepID=B9RNH5_RICCO|nr:uncharacterized protein LOC8265152 [Ricinus communis]EEF47298.1 conserved hypothetical protein [Ricinus communis]|eukprot:XP_002515314.1 uncharacterized protein LOC8265152 [Ricinus communis]
MARKNRNDIGKRAWNILRLALLWARKGGVFKRSLMVELPKFLKSLGHTTSSMTTPRNLYHRQLSFDKTPIIHVKMHRPASMRFNIPCITPRVDFDYDFDGASEDEDGGFMCGRRSFLKGREEEEEGNSNEYDQERIPEEEKGIDLRAEEFIANFYQQMKLQRQISYLQYNETPKRSIS